MKQTGYTKEQIQAIQDYALLIRLWAQGKISPHNMTKTQINLIKNFCKTDINWQNLTGTK